METIVLDQSTTALQQRATTVAQPPTVPKVDPSIAWPDLVSSLRDTHELAKLATALAS